MNCTQKNSIDDLIICDKVLFQTIYLLLKILLENITYYYIIYRTPFIDITSLKNIFS